ncbi:MAG: D-2-hydroxyacid dehydrogenase [Candidatus Limiplasma sp.]|nr:D-2-hydroxyacid dehydrogenase [Candidatus Limiplasma sp.]
MSRTLIVTLAQLTERHRARLRAAAGARGFTVVFFDTEAEAAPALAEAEILFSQSGRLAGQAPRLRWQCTPSAGVNQFTDSSLFESGAAVLSNSSGAYGVTIAEHIVMVALELMRRQQDYAQVVARREWTRDLAVRSLRDSRITLLGTGDIGQETAIRLRAFSPARLVGVNRSGVNPRGLLDQVASRGQLPALLPQTDLLILSLPGTAETDGMLDAGRLSLLPDGAILVNVGRSNAVDQQALETELRAGRLSAALDVFAQEPLPPEHSLWSCPNLLLTPHVAGNMTLPYTLDRIVALFLEDFENYCAGRPLTRQVDLKRGY